MSPAPRWRTENVSGNNTWTGSITLASDVAIGTTSGTLSITGAIGEIGGSRTLTRLGTGALILGGTNTYTGKEP